jgi:hypothetical protein
LSRHFRKESTGGPDFICRPEKQPEFLVEVKSIDSEAVTHKSGLPDKINKAGTSAFGLITTALDRSVAKKTRQLSKHPYPMALAITSSHAFSTILMDGFAAHNLLLSEPMISHRIGDPSDTGSWVTNLQNSPFLRKDESGEQIVPCRQSISVIFLIALCWDQAHVVGILHPEPAIPFNPAVLWRVPYLRLKTWPITDGILQTEWIHSGENPAVFHYA